jgi:hypothetical protein
MIKLKSGRQEVIAAILSFTYADIVASGVAEDAIEVPDGAIVVGGDITVVTPWNTTGAATLSLGDAGSATRYANAVNLKAAARTALTLTGYKHSVVERLKALVTTADLDADEGEARITLHYIRDGRVAFSQGLDSRGAGLPGA